MMDAAFYLMIGGMAGFLIGMVASWQAHLHAFKRDPESWIAIIRTYVDDEKTA